MELALFLGLTAIFAFGFCVFLLHVLSNWKIGPFYDEDN